MGYFIIVITTFLVTACASPSKNLRILSEPDGAQVSLVSANGDTRELGTTPYELSESQLLTHNGDVFGFKFQKEGYEVERVYIENPTKNFHGELRVKLYPASDWSQAFVDKKATRYLNDVAQMTAEIQGALASKDLVRGEQAARSLTTRYPGIAVGWTLLGNVFYMQNRKSEALEAYNKSLSLDPTNQETKNVIERLRGM